MNRFYAAPITRFVIVLIIALLLASCAKPYRSGLIEPADKSFHGIHPASFGGTTTNFVMIHGMCHHDKIWMDDTIKMLAEKFEMQVMTSYPIFPASDIDIKTEPVIAFKGRIYDETYTINVYGITYGNATRTLKDAHLCRDIDKGVESPACIDKKDGGYGKGKYDKERASLNATVKNILMNDCLADAVIYMSDTGIDIRNRVKNALAAIYDNIEDFKSPVVLSSESLGSKILRDALLCQEDLNTSKAKALVFESRLIFLFSNQIPLLNIGNAEACNTRQIESKMRAMEELKTVVPSEEPAPPILTGGFSDIFKVFEMQPKEKSPLFDFYPLMDKSKFPDERPRFTIVSFTDPNDILSYEVDKGEYEDNTVVNVVVSNDYTYFGKFENPDKAHRGYGDNKVVLKTLKCGFNNSHVEECLEN